MCGSSRTAKCQAIRGVGGYEGLIGNTPMVHLESLSAATGCQILVKVCSGSQRYMNPQQPVYTAIIKQYGYSYCKQY